MPTIQIYLRVKCDKKVIQLYPAVKQFFVDLINKVDEEEGHRGYALVVDATSAGISNANLEMLQFVISTIKDYFPLGLRYTLLYNLPGVLRTFWPVVKIWLGDYKKMIMFANGEEIKKFVDVDNLPKYLGGTCTKSFTKPPDCSPSVYQVADQFGLTPHQVAKYMKLYEDLLNESYKLDHL